MGKVGVKYGCVPKHLRRRKWLCCCGRTAIWGDSMKGIALVVYPAENKISLLLNNNTAAPGDPNLVVLLVVLVILLN